MSDTPQPTLEERLSKVCATLEAVSGRLDRNSRHDLLVDHMIAILEHDNSMALYALKEFAKKLEAKEAESRLVKYIDERAELIRDMRAALRKLEEQDTVPPQPPDELAEP